MESCRQRKLGNTALMLTQLAKHFKVNRPLFWGVKQESVNCIHYGNSVCCAGHRACRYSTGLSSRLRSSYLVKP